MPDFFVGEYARLVLTAANESGALGDPATVTLKVRAPDGTVTTYPYGTAAEVARDFVGSYHGVILLNQAGRWYWRWETTAPNAGATEGDLVVKRSNVL